MFSDHIYYVACFCGYFIKTLKHNVSIFVVLVSYYIIVNHQLMAENYFVRNFLIQHAAGAGFDRIC